MKSRPVVYHPGARVEALDAFIWYEERQPGLGERFQHALLVAEKFITSNPELGLLFEYGTRRWRLNDFPYKVIYLESPDRLKVVAVMHDSRQPEYWAARLD